MLLPLTSTIDCVSTPNVEATEDKLSEG
jgi:hypothetical protein